MLNSKSVSKKNGNVEKLKRDLKHVMDAIVNCYSGDCKLCKKYSQVCNGHTDKFLLSTNLDFSDPADEHVLRQCLKYRLGSKGVDLTALNSNTQKSESINRTYQKTNPKTVTWLRNFASRIHSAVHLRNNGFVQSTSNKLAALGVAVSPETFTYMKAEERNIKLKVQHLKSVRQKKAAYKKIQDTYRLYDKLRDTKKEETVHYKRNVSLPNIKHVKCKPKPCKPDHCYASMK